MLDSKENDKFDLGVKWLIKGIKTESNQVNLHPNLIINQSSILIACLASCHRRQPSKITLGYKLVR